MRPGAVAAQCTRLWAINRQNCPSVARQMTTLTQVALAKEDMSTDIQEDSSADPQALDESKKVADNSEAVRMGNQKDAQETGDPVRFEPEVTQSARGSGFPHQTNEDRENNLASSTQGEAAVKTREYTPSKDNSKVYPEE